MAEIHRVRIWGAGAMGSLYAWKFFQDGETAVSLLAAGERARRLADKGLCVNGNRFRPEVVAPGDRIEASDLVLVALKHHHLVGAADELAASVGPDTLILSVMNGIDSEGILGEYHGSEKVLPAVALGMDALRDNGDVVYTRAGRILFGPPPDRKNPSEVVGRVQRALDRAGIDWETPPDIQRVLWWKLMINVGVNQASAVLRAPFGVFHESAAARELMVSAMREVIAVARCSGVDLTERDIEEWLSVLSGLSPEGKTSMLQDVEDGRKTEVEIFAGRIVSEGRRCRVPTPVNETLLQILQVYERQRGGEAS